MQERVLGGIIIGGVALVGVIWALAAGIPPLINAQNNEKKLEAALVEKVKEYDASITKLDVKRVSYAKENEAIKNKFDEITYKPWAIVNLEGYNNEGQLFKCVYKANQSYIADLQIKLSTASASISDSLSYDVYQNYTMTTSTFLLDLIGNEGTEFKGYYVGQGSYGSLYANEGTKIVSVGDITVPNGKSNRPYSIDQAKALTTTDSASNYVFGSVTSIEKDNSITDYDAYNIWLASDDGKTEQALRVLGAALGTGVKEVKQGDQIVLTSPIVVEDGTVTLKSSEASGKLVSTIVTSIGLPTELKDQALNVADANKAIEEFAKEGDKKTYGKVDDEYSYVTGVVAGVTINTDDQGKESYDIRLVTEGTTEDNYFLITNATFDKTTVSETFTKITDDDGIDSLKDFVGKQITVKGKLTTAMNYKQVTK